MHPGLRYAWTALPLLLLLTCCKPSSQKEDRSSGDPDSALTADAVAVGYYRDIFMPEKEKVFRDVSMDLSADQVKSIESGYTLSLTDESDEHLQYEMDLRVDTVSGVDYVEVKYIFDQQDRLDIVTVNYYIRDSLMINQLFDHLNSSFIERYGDYYIDSDGYTVWESTYQRSDTVEITYDIGIRKFTKLNDPGITIELMRFGSL